MKKSGLMPRKPFVGAGGEAIERGRHGSGSQEGRAGDGLGVRWEEDGWRRGQARKEV